MCGSCCEGICFTWDYDIKLTHLIMAAAHITKAIRNIPLFQNANWINATLWLKMSNGVEGEKGGIRLDFTFDSSSLQFQEWLTPLCIQKSLLETLDHLCSFSYWISRLAKSQMRSTKGPTLYNCRESFFSVWKKKRWNGAKKKFLPEVVCGCSKKKSWADELLVIVID